MMTRVSKLPSHQNVKCHFCDKVFCCESCRDKHELNKHGRLEQKCPLCYNDKVQIKDFDNSLLLNHLVEHHFPLCCNLCGQVFRKASDLQMFQQCRWKCSPAETKQKSSIEKEPNQALYTPSPITRHLHFDNHSDLKKSFSEGFIKMHEQEVPKINRYTSTPLQGSVNYQKLGANKLSKMITKDFNFLIKTPQTPRCISTINSLSDAEVSTSGSDNMKQDLESQYFSDVGENENKSDSDSISSITSPLLSTNKSVWKSCKDFSKIVQNSECESCKESETKFMDSENKENSPEAYDKDFVQNVEDQEHVFESVTEQSVDMEKSKNQTEESFEKNVPANCDSSVVDSKLELDVEGVSADEQMLVKNSTEDSKTDSEASKSESESVQKDVPVTFSTQEFVSGESTRMIMMVVVEKNGSEFSSADFRPILESGLKKLEQAASMKNVAQAPVPVNENFQALTPIRKMRDRDEPQTVLSAVQGFRENFRAVTPIRKMREGEKPETVLSAVKEFSYVRVSGTTYSTPIKHDKKSTISVEKKENVPETHYGFMSSMTRALMNVFRKIPDKMSLRSLSRQPTLAIAPAPLSAENRQIEYSSPIASPSRKRRRDEMESPKRADSPAILAVETPLAKKYRGGWIKVKARPPIRHSSSYDQMRISATTQRFQQGLLSSGNTVIPIPSRAQTDNGK